MRNVSMGVCTLLIHALLYGIFVVRFGGVLECAAEACRCHLLEMEGRKFSMVGRRVVLKVSAVWISCIKAKGDFLRRQRCLENGGKKVEPHAMTFWGAWAWTPGLA
jgi:hypothetical protein